MRFIEEKIEKIGDSLIITAITGLISLFGTWLLKAPFYVYGLIGLIFLLIYYLHKFWRQAIQIKAIGVKQISLSRVSNTKDVLEQASLRFDFWGESGNRTVKSEKFEPMLKRISERSGSVRFLLLDPESEAVSRRALDECETPQSHRSDINATIERLQNFRKSGYSMIEIRLYSDYPKWRIAIVDSSRMHVNYFTKGRRANESPEIILIDGVDSMLQAFRKSFDDIWETSKTI